MVHMLQLNPGGLLQGHWHALDLIGLQSKSAAEGPATKFDLVVIAQGVTRENGPMTRSDQCQSFFIVKYTF